MQNANGSARRRGDEFARLALEHLGRVCTPDESSAVLSRALDLSGVSAVPEEPVGFGLFARGPLRSALEEVIDPEIAKATSEALTRVVRQLVQSGVRRRPEQLRERAERVVLLVLQDEQRAERVGAHLRGYAEVHRARDVFGLLQMAERYAERELYLVIDGGFPGLRGPMLATLARVLPESAHAIFWGGPPPGRGFERSRHLPSASTPSEVAAFCRGEAELPPEVEATRKPVLVLADDDPVWRATLRRRLEHEGYEVVSCPDGFTALEACIDHQPDVVVSDHDMPTLDGSQLAALLVSRFQDEAPPFFIVSSREVTASAGVTGVLRKQDGLPEILGAVRRHAPPPRQS